MKSDAQTVRSAHAPRTILVLIVLTIAGIVLCALAVGIGSVFIKPTTVVEILVYRLTGIGNPMHWTLVQDDIVWNLRFPRVLLAGVVGSALSVVGVVAQAVMRNPLADPYVLGISSGAALGAVAWIVFGAVAFGGASVGLAAFAGAMLALFAVVGFVRLTGTFSASRLVLAGIVIGTGLSGITNYLIFQAEDPGTTQSSLFWLLGGLGGARWNQLPLPFLVLIIGVLLVLTLSRQLNALLLGEATAAALGVEPNQIRLLLYVVAAALTGVAVAVSGSISFVGLIVPHAVRLLVGSDHRRLTPVAAVLGAVFMVAVDLIGRTLTAPQELPLGVVTAVIGAPIFLLLMGHRTVRLGDS
jgi:iron complex transport system permease protein